MKIQISKIRERRLDLKKALYPNVELELTRNNMLRKELGAKVGMKPTLISFKLNGKSEITFDEAISIKEALNSEMSLETLFKKSEVTTEELTTV